MIVNDKLAGLIIRWCGVRLPGGPPKIEKPLFAVAFFTCLGLSTALEKWGLLLRVRIKTPVGSCHNVLLRQKMSQFIVLRHTARHE